MAVDPVCKMQVNESKAKFVSESKGAKVYFCSAACKRSYDADPSKYS